jgi:putative transposase
MSQSRHTEARTIAPLRHVEVGRKVEDVVLENGVSKHTVYAWKTTYGGMDASQSLVKTAQAVAASRRW